MGMFDPELDPTGNLTLEPSPLLQPLSAEQLGVPHVAVPQVAMPQAPQMAPGPGNAQRLISMALLGLAAGLGPRRGGGIAQGLMAGQHANEQERQRQFQNDQAVYKEQQQEALRQQALQTQLAQAEAAKLQQRQQALQQALNSIRGEVKTIPDKATYDQRIEGYAQLLQGSGYRLDANWLRSAVPYVAPTGKQKAEAALTAFFKNPLTAQQLKENPNAVANGSMQIDLNGDGVPELVPVRQVMEAAGMSVLADNQGNPVALTGGQQGDLKHIKLKALIDQFKAENRREPTGKEMAKLVDEAEKKPAEPKEPSLMQVTDIDPDTGEIVTSLVPKRAGEVARKPAKEPNQAQFQAGTYAGRMEQSTAILDKLEKNVSAMNPISFAAQGRAIPALQSADYQSYDQAARNFINAVLRKESGAAISPSEFDNARRQYLPMPGDTPQTLAQKKANRDYAFQTMKSAAGRAYQAPIAPPNTDPAATGRAKLAGR